MSRSGANKFNGTFLVSVADGTVDTTTDLRLLGKNYAGYGEVQNENFLHLLENFANTSPPPKAINGQAWFDSAEKRLKFYDAVNTKWRTTGGLEVSSTAPVKMNVGDFWYDTSADQLYSWNGNAFVLIGPQPTVGGSQTATSVAIVKGTDGINYNIVKMIAGAGDTVAIIANDAFTLDSILNPIPGFSAVKKGITLVNTDINGVTTTDNIFWGTASNAARLGGVLASEFVQKGASAFTSQVAFTNAGYTVGTPGNNLAVFIELGDQPIIESRNSARITVRIRENPSVAHDIMEFIAPTVNPGAAIPGITSTFDLGTPISKWKNVYADDFVGRLTGNVTGNTLGAHKGNIVASDDSTAYNATTKEFLGSFTGILTGNVIGDVTGTSSNAFTLNNLQGSVATANSTVVIRDSTGNINANNFVGTSSRADQLLVAGIGYRSATTAPTANTIMVRDSNGSISANLLNGTATAANTLQTNGGDYVTASTFPIGNTVVVRDSAGNIQVNGIIGSATTAVQLQVDGGTFRLATTSAVANTVVVRDAEGVIRAASIQNTPIGTTQRSSGAFTTLTSNNSVTFTQNTNSTGTSSGTLVVTGGAGISGQLYAGGVQGTPIGSLVRSSGAFTTLTSNSTATFTLTTDSSSTTSGAVVVSGGIGILGNVYTGKGIIQTPGALGTTIGATTLYQSLRGSNSNNNFLETFMLRTSAGTSWETTATRIQQKIDSTWMGWMQFNGTGNSGGIGWGSGTSTSGITAIPERMRLDSDGILRLYATTASSSTTTGALVVAGGLGVAGRITTTELVETSSITLKENVTPITNALENIMKISGVTYDRTDNKVHEAGLIAEWVNEILPDLVTKDDLGNAVGIKYTKLTAYLIESIKTLKQEIDELRGNR